LRKRENCENVALATWRLVAILKFFGGFLGVNPQIADHEPVKTQILSRKKEVSDPKGVCLAASAAVLFFTSAVVLGGLRVFSPEFARRKNGIFLKGMRRFPPYDVPMKLPHL